ncbi:LysM peptidoglycan-binding domain-containing protein [Vermiculatibacterium agrestimuris]|uniref:LysM peptidoglycan-binding domain-containing protein n=1 Tax=Vermiculatibacterium agrestimuris TaxID=2941519 RepID=UPI00203B1E14|nr:LysM peptidoglycan-binding domain-containing protein [Vermiculatibacterium agrestimuris]
MAGKQFIFKNTRTEEVFVLPVTPAGYQITHGRKAVKVDMHGTGEVNLPGEPTLLDETIECFFPSRAYPFAQPGSSVDPFVPLETLEKWSDSGVPVRFIVAGTPVNALVLLDPIQYGERDGTGDLYVTIPMRGYRLLTASATELTEAGNEARSVETEPTHAATYVIQRGDTLSAIAKWVYGNAGLYGKLAAANNIANPDLIYVGQVLTLPDVEALPAAKTPVRAHQIVTATKTELEALAEETSPGASTLKDMKWKVRLSREEGKALVNAMEAHGWTRADVDG